MGYTFQASKYMNGLEWVSFSPQKYIIEIFSIQNVYE